MSSLQRLLALVVLAGAAVVFCGLGIPLVTGQVYTDTDLGAFHLPVRSFYAHALATGESFTWMPHMFTGFYLHGEGQGGLLHPLNLLLYSLLPLPIAFDVEVLRSYVFLFAGTFLFLRRAQLGPDAALLAAFLFTFSGFSMSHFVHPNLIGVIAHLPWLLLVIDVGLPREATRATAWAPLGVALLTASQILLGHPEAVWISSLTEGLWVVYLLAVRHPRPSRVLALAAAKLLAVLAASVQILPTWDALLASVRTLPTFGERPILAVSPVALLQLAVPYLFRHRFVGEAAHDAVVYVGPAVPALFAWLLVRRGALRPWRALVAGAAVLAALGLVLALGERAYLYRLIGALPVVGSFRVAARYLLLFYLALAVGVAVALADLTAVAEGRRPRPERLWPLALPPLAGVAAAGAALWLKRVTPDVLLRTQIASDASVAFGVAMVALAALLVLMAARGARAAVVALVLLAVVDQGVYALQEVRRVPPRDWATYGATVPRALYRQPGTAEGGAGTPGARARSPDLSLIVKGIRLVNGYASLPPVRQLDVGGGRAGVDERLIRAWRVAGVAWAGGITVPNPLPRARLVTRAVESRHPDEDLLAIDIASVALVSEPVVLEPGTPGQARIVRDRPGEIDVRTRAATRQLLVVSESHHPGWHVTVDGVPARVLPVFGDFMGCVLEAGTHDVRFRFAPASLRTGAWLSALGLALLGLWAVVISTRRRPKDPATELQRER